MRHLQALHLAGLITPSFALQPQQPITQPVFTTHPAIDFPPRLNFSSPHPLIFHSTFSLLQQWANTFYPTGLTVAPCIIPKHTTLYHAHHNGSFPPSPEWFGFDASMAYAILGSLPDSHLLTFRTTKDVKCLYFDGASAALMGDGTMDSQMLLIHNSSNQVPEDPHFGMPPSRPGHNETGPPDRYGRPPPGRYPLEAEYNRAEGLCSFIKEKNLGGPGWGYEGFVRMNAAFEMIWCNFSSPSAKMISWLNVSSPRIEGIEQSLSDSVSLLDDPPKHPPRLGKPFWDFRSMPFRGRSVYEWFLSATKTYGFVGGTPGRGEVRIKIDSCGLFSFYDPLLHDQEHARIEQERRALNLTVRGYWQQTTASDREAALQRLARRRRWQRAVNVSESDGQYMRDQIASRMRDTLEDSKPHCSGIDWVSVAQTIVAIYSADIYELKTALNETPPFTNTTRTREWLSNIRGLAHHLYMPYYEYPPLPLQDPLDVAFSVSVPTSQAALARCKDQTSLSQEDIDQLSSSESLTHQAVSDVLSNLCSTLLSVFLSTEVIWLSHFNNISHIPELAPPLRHTITSTMTRHLHAIEELMAWLGWADQWTNCSPGCEFGMTCAIPIWPVMGIGHFSGPDGGRDGWMPNGREANWLESRCVDAEHLW